MSGFLVRNKNGTEKAQIAVEGGPGEPIVVLGSIDQAFDLIEKLRSTHAGPPVRCPGCTGGCDCLPVRT